MDHKLADLYMENMRYTPEQQEKMKHVTAIKNNFTALVGRLEYALSSNTFDSDPALRTKISELTEAVTALSDQYDQHMQYAHIDLQPQTGRVQQAYY